MSLRQSLNKIISTSPETSKVEKKVARKRGEKRSLSIPCWLLNWLGLAIVLTKNAFVGLFVNSLLVKSLHRTLWERIFCVFCQSLHKRVLCQFLASIFRTSYVKNTKNVPCEFWLYLQGTVQNSTEVQNISYSCSD